MAITAYPKPSTSITTDQFRDYFREILSTGALNDAAWKPSADSSGLLVKCAGGLSVIDGVLAKNSSSASVAVGGGSGGGLSRKDTLVANLDFSATPIIALAVLPGTPAASNPAPPSLALTGSIVFRWPICDIAVSPTASTINAGDITDRRTFVGSDVKAWATADRPSAPRMYQFGFNTTLGRWEFWNGAGWTRLGTGISAADLTGVLAIANGGTGATDWAAARTALGIRVTNTPMTAGTPDGTLRAW